MDAILGSDSPPAQSPEPTGDSPGAPAQPDPSANSPSLAGPGQGGGFNWIFGGEGSEGAQDGVQPGETPPATPAAQPDAKSIDELFDAAIPAVPDWLKGAEQKKLDDFSGMRELLRKQTHDNQALQLQIAEARKAAPAAGGEGAQPMPESEAVKALQAEIATLKPAAEQWRTEEARRGIGESVGFRKEFDAPRSAILKELTTAAKKAGIDNPESAAEEFLRLESEYDQTEWIADNFDDDDSRPAKFFGTKGKEFRSLTDRANAELSAPDPIARLKDWQDYEAAFSTKFAATMSDSIKGQFLSAFPRVRAQLLDGQAGDPLFFQTESGVSTLNGIMERLQSGNGIAPEEVIAGLASIERANAYRALAAQMSQRIQELQKQIGTNSRVDPGANFQQTPAPDGGNGTPDNMPNFGPGRFAPLVSPEQLGAALR